MFNDISLLDLKIGKLFINFMINNKFNNNDV